MSIAAGEYVSVSSQSDSEQADLSRERAERAANGEFERNELASIYVRRGLQPKLAQQVAAQFIAHNALTTHARDELGVSEITRARPTQAALASAATFAVGAAIPLLTVLIGPTTMLIPAVIGTSVLLLALLGGFGAYVGGAPVVKAAWRVIVWGALAVALTGGAGAIFGAAV